jgi:putative ABC transport system permease protein
MSAGGRLTGSAAHRRLRNGLIGAQVALAFVLLTNAALLTRSFLQMRSADLGFDGGSVVAVQLSRAANHFATSEAFRTFMREAAARIQALPGVSDVAFVDGLPMQGAPRMTFVQNADAPILERAQRPVADFKNVGADYFRVLRLRLRQGRALRDADRATAPLVAVINETMARTFFGGVDAIGKRLLMDAPVFGDVCNGETASLTVVGVVSDERLTPVDDRRERPVMYVSNQQYPTDFAGVIVRTSVAAPRMEKPIRAAVAAVDKGVAVAHVWPVDQLESESRLPARLRAALLTVFAALALALSALGIYGVMSYTVVQRTHEIGVRTALGARVGAVVRMVVWQGMRWALAGAAAGALASVWVTRLLRSFLFGVGATDATSWIGALVILLIVAMVACCIPARSAARIDPLDALRVP